MWFSFLSAGVAQKLFPDLRLVETGAQRPLALDSARIPQECLMYPHTTASPLGYAFGHPTLDDYRQIMSSQLIYVDSEVGIARTVHRWYPPGHPAGSGRA